MTSYLLSQEPFEDRNNSLSTIVSNNEFETLLTRIKTTVDQNLAENSKKTRQKSPPKRVKPSLNKRRLLLSSRSQSVDETNSRKSLIFLISIHIFCLASHPIKLDLNEHSIEL